MTPEPSFVRDLTAYDAQLRVRWGKHSERWLIERKLAIRNPAWLAERPLNPFGTGKRKKDLYEGWRAGYVHVMSVHPSLLNWRTVGPALAATDREMAGSWKALADKMDAVDAAEDAARERTVKNWSEAAAGDAADSLQWRFGHRVATPLGGDPREPKEPKDVIEYHEGFTVRLRAHAYRGSRGESPLRDALEAITTAPESPDATDKVTKVMMRHARRRKSGAA